MAFQTKREGEAPADPLRLLFFQPRFCATSAKHSRPWHFGPNGRGRLPPTLCACCFFNHDFARHRPNIRAYGISGQTGGGGSRRPLRLFLFQPRMDTNRHEYLNSGFRPTSSQQCPKYNALYSCSFVSIRGSYSNKLHEIVPPSRRKYDIARFSLTSITYRQRWFWVRLSV